MFARRWILLLILAAIPFQPARAQWQPDGAPVYNYIYGGPGEPHSFAAVPDGNGGVLIFWNDSRIGRSHIWMQHLDAGGNRLWATDGVPIWGLNGEMSAPRATTDGRGGAIVTWSVIVDAQFNTDLYAQHVASDGSQTWGVDGTDVCTAAGAQHPTSIISDGFFSPVFGQGPGAIIAWIDTRTGPLQQYVYTQALDNLGNKLWAPSGVLCSQA